MELDADGFAKQPGCITAVPMEWLRLIRESAQKAGFDRSIALAFSGHSMRVGAAQDLLCAGHDTAAIMRAGGWKSVDVLVRYLE